jgi:rod shape determining protein RodA
MSIYSNRKNRDRFRENFSQFDRVLTFSVASLLIIGTLLVYAATRNWFASQGLDPEYYLKRHVVIF